MPATRMKIAPMHAEHRRGPGVGAEERGRDDVLDLRRARQRVHGEGEGAERDRAGNQPLRDVALAEQSRRRTDTPRTPPRTATRRRRSATRTPARSTASPAARPTSRMVAATIDLREPGQLDQLAEDRAEQEHREVQLQEADHLVHEQAGEHRRDQATGRSAARRRAPPPARTGSRCSRDRPRTSGSTARPARSKRPCLRSFHRS